MTGLEHLTKEKSPSKVIIIGEGEKIKKRGDFMSIKELLIKRQKLSEPIQNEKIEAKRQEIFKGKKYLKTDKQIKEFLKNMK